MTCAWDSCESSGWGRAGKAARGCHSPLSGKFPTRGDLSLTSGPELSWLPGYLEELLLQEAHRMCLCVCVCVCTRMRVCQRQKAYKEMITKLRNIEHLLCANFCPVCLTD